ncbi:SDR family NAD(P)-dependent oxidoreductase [Enterovirga sp.]|jgi:NAD(P)-dependent dehydrogenase (short-subunit alcohol dehydrogenase family)|uniref:SDR family NAD(P)-dependent oxidoreductase n=1 Tax=Enterovirga sp. TaxID=2026350 RepID=UPI002620F3AF|nr:SDR family NAD(P)-dependent oxidoreductase [Enterovirga sp.]MDB5590468.1 putative short-chain dehydrogenase/reductase [Enterovirga sp.]
MKVAGQVVVVTGGASGIGRALARRFAQEGARAVVVADLDGPGAEAVGRAIGGEGFACDVSREADLVGVIDRTEERFGPIGLFCSNAGVLAGLDRRSEHPAGAADELWQHSWAVNVMAHVWAARALVPRMKARGGGWFLNTASAAGLLSQIGSAIYSTTKHASIGFAENLAIAHRDDGIRVAVLCPQGVDTPMLGRDRSNPAALDGVLSPDQVAEAAVRGLEAETFLILPHAQVAGYMRVKAEDYDRWLGGMVKLQRRLRQSPPEV